MQQHLILDPNYRKIQTNNTLFTQAKAKQQVTKTLCKFFRNIEAKRVKKRCFTTPVQTCLTTTTRFLQFASMMTSDWRIIGPPGGQFRIKHRLLIFLMSSSFVTRRMNTPFCKVSSLLQYHYCRRPSLGLGDGVRIGDSDQGNGNTH